MDEENIRPPDLIYRDTLVNNNYNDDDDDIDADFKKAIQQSLKEHYDQEQLIKDQEQLIKDQEQLIKDQEQKELNDKLNKQIERKNILGKIYEKMLLIKFYNKDTISNSFILLLSVINKYINCYIDNYDINNEIYNNILYELSKIRIKDNELSEIKKIFNIINL
jgi:hypothetical protein